MEDLLAWKWGFFSPTHIGTLIIAVVGCVALYYFLRNKSKITQTVVLLLFSLLGPITMLNEIICYAPMQSILRYLPLHLCSFNALLCPVLILTKNEFLGNLCSIFSLGSGLAVIFNSIQADYSIFSVVFILYYSSHVMGCAIPFIMWRLGHFKMSLKYTLPCILTIIVLYTIAHGVNLFINSYCLENNIVDGFGELISVNYMFSISTMANPALEFFWSIIPYPYFYLYVAFPFVALYLCLLNIKTVVAFFKEKFSKRA